MRNCIIVQRTQEGLSARQDSCPRPAARLRGGWCATTTSPPLPHSDLVLNQHWRLLQRPCCSAAVRTVGTRGRIGCAWAATASSAAATSTDTPRLTMTSRTTPSTAGTAQLEAAAAAAAASVCPQSNAAVSRICRSGATSARATSPPQYVHCSPGGVLTTRSRCHSPRLLAFGAHRAGAVALVFRPARGQVRHRPF